MPFTAVMADIFPDNKAQMAKYVGTIDQNMFGLSPQVPAKPSYLTNATIRTRRIAGQNIQLKRVRVALLDNIPDNANLALQALSYFGKSGTDDQIIGRCARILTDKDLAGLHHAMGRVPGWMADAIHKIEHIKHGQIHRTTRGR